MDRDINDSSENWYSMESSEIAISKSGARGHVYKQVTFSFLILARHVKQLEGLLVQFSIICFQLLDVV